MRNYFLAFMLAVLVVLSGVTLRGKMTAIGTSPVPVPPTVAAIGTSPVPVPPTAIGTSPVPVPPTAR